MNKYRTLMTLVLLIATTCLSACASDRSAYDSDYGQSVRNMIISQTHDPLATVSPPTGAKGQDGQKAEAVLEAYRGSVGDPTNIGEGDRATTGFVD